MDPEHFNEFNEVRHAVYDGLRSGFYVGRDNGLPVCRLLVPPSFGNAVGWDVLTKPIRRKPAQPRLFRSCWRMDLDGTALGSPVERLRHPRPYRPTVEVDSAPIDGAKIEELIRRLRNIQVPLVVAEAPFGLDGTRYELELGSLARARLAWWVRLPKEWEALGPVIEEMTELFESSWRGVELSSDERGRGDGVAW